MEKERVFKIADINGEEYAVVCVHTFDIGKHQMNCVILKLRSNLPKGYKAASEFWIKFGKTLSDYLEINPEDILYFCHPDIPRNLARLRLYEYMFRQYVLMSGSPAMFFVCRGVDNEGTSRHLMFGMNKSNSEFEALKSVIEENADQLIRDHLEIQNAEHSVLRIGQ